jgi:hypothetical protein
VPDRVCERARPGDRVWCDTDRHGNIVTWPAEPINANWVTGGTQQVLGANSCCTSRWRVLTGTATYNSCLQHW